MTQGYTFDTVLNGFAATVKANDLPKLLTIEGVTLIEPDATVYASEDNTMQSSDLIKQDQVEAQMNTSNSFLGIEQLWNEGIEGQGIKVAVLDTGIDADHPEFAGIYKGGKTLFHIHQLTRSLVQMTMHQKHRLRNVHPGHLNLMQTEAHSILLTVHMLPEQLQQSELTNSVLKELRQSRPLCLPCPWSIRKRSNIRYC